MGTFFDFVTQHRGLAPALERARCVRVSKFQLFNFVFQEISHETSFRFGIADGAGRRPVRCRSTTDFQRDKEKGCAEGFCTKRFSAAQRAKASDRGSTTANPYNGAADSEPRSAYPATGTEA